MSQTKEKAARKHLREHTSTTVMARWRRPWRWLPGLPSDWFGIGMFPKLQWFFQFTMIHKVEVDAPMKEAKEVDDSEEHD